MTNDKQLAFWEDDDVKSKPLPDTSEALAIISLMDRAAVHLKWPKIRIGNIAFIRTRTGAVMVSVNRDRRCWIQRDGSLQQARCKPADDNLVKFILVFAKAPEKWAQIQGIKTGRCCYCGRELSCPASVTVGYGPICADKWGLPWGDADFKNDAKNIEEIEG